ncbi:uncharacterized protein PAC_02016 [Phialocephala subalpina]|uniref:Uncharacterized protein n=1 Tax=Phialocephala subalpina TaxID=576137 RepID=A0A1L7WH90_9HELO|nr:uncharacterized protein PAC_02016 [Phialocephala subalpina]
MFGVNVLHNFAGDILREHLRTLQMDWGLEPHWWLGSQQEGPTLLRSFPRLKTFTLVVSISKLAQEDGEKEMMLMDIVKRHTVAKMEVERSRHPEWRMPIVKFHWKKDYRDWNIHSIAESLLPENQRDTQLLYDWVRQ